MRGSFLPAPGRLGMGRSGHLSLTRRSGWLQAHISKRGDLDAAKAAAARAALVASASRYVDFIELRDARPGSVPTRDISVCWSADLLRPTVGTLRQGTFFDVLELASLTPLSPLSTLRGSSCDVA